MRIIKVNKKRGNIVLSRKALLEENAEKKHTLRALAEGKVLKGVVRTSPTTGRSSILAASTVCCTSPTCHGAASAIRRAVQGQRRDRRDRARNAIRDRARVLGHKQLITDPWANVMDRYPVGGRAVEVVSLTDTARSSSSKRPWS
jgi:small subunit ribosomal protein S1